MTYNVFGVMLNLTQLQPLPSVYYLKIVSFVGPLKCRKMQYIDVKFQRLSTLYRHFGQNVAEQCNHILPSLAFWHCISHHCRNGLNGMF